MIAATATLEVAGKMSIQSDGGPQAHESHMSSASHLSRCFLMSSRRSAIHLAARSKKFQVPGSLLPALFILRLAAYSSAPSSCVPGPSFDKRDRGYVDQQAIHGRHLTSIKESVLLAFGVQLFNYRT